MSYLIETIAEEINAKRIGEYQATINWLLTDTRILSFPEETLFFVIDVSKANAIHYIQSLHMRGIRNFVVDNRVKSEDLSLLSQGVCSDCNFLIVADVLKALHKLASLHREKFHVPIIGITGSNGKTVVKEWLYQLLSSDRNIVRSPRSYNSNIGVPLSVWQMNEDTELGIFEAGVAKPGEMRTLQQIIKPTIGIFTSIGSAHQESFFSQQEKCVEKLSLLKDCDIVIYNGDDEMIGNSAIKTLSSAREIAWSKRDEDRPLYISKIDKQKGHTLVYYRYLGLDNFYKLPFVDDASIENSIHCLAACLYLMVSPDEINNRMANLEAISRRLEVKEGKNNCLLINDSYNVDIVSLEIALDLLQRFSSERNQKSVLILSDILGSGQNAQNLYRSVAQMISTHQVTKLIGVGNEITSAATRFDMEKHFFSTTEELLQSDILSDLQDEVVLIKGARKFALERVSQSLEWKKYDLFLEVNTSALVNNLNYYKSLMKPEGKIICMVKASAYGAGAVEVSKVLQKQGVDYFGVAVVEEGVELCEAGITTPIMVMNPEVSASKTMFEYGLEPELYDFQILESFIKAAEKEGVINYPVHLQINTGMNRLGFDVEEIPLLIKRLKSQNSVIPRSVFSHLSGSDSAEFDDFSAKQIQLFDKASAELQASFNHHIFRHICNSAGTQRFPHAQYDMVRPGIGLYGVNPVHNKLINNVTTLKAAILQIHNVPAGETIGYSRKGKVTKDSRIAVLRMGYGDGLNRRLGNGNAYCLVNGEKAPYIGNICMDMCMIDVTGIDCEEGDYVIIFGEELPVTYLADVMDTISYEVLTGITNRVKRVYYQD